MLEKGFLPPQSSSTLEAFFRASPALVPWPVTRLSMIQRAERHPVIVILFNDINLLELAEKTTMEKRLVELREDIANLMARFIICYFAPLMPPPTSSTVIKSMGAQHTRFNSDDVIVLIVVETGGAFTLSTAT